MKLHPRLRFLAAIALGSFALNAAQAKQLKPTDYALSIQADRPELFYHKGEKVTFTISLTCKGAVMKDANVKWKISKDGVEPPLQQGTASMKDGAVVVSGSLNEPGFLQCRADFTAPGESVPTARAGVAVDPLEIKPSLPAPPDFDVYWKEQKAKLAAIPMNVRITPVKSSVAGVECFDVQADCLGAPMSAYLARPIGAKPKSLPATVLLHGAGVASSRLSAAAAWAKDGFVALDFNAHGLPSGKPQEFYSNLYKTELAKYYLKNPESRDTIFFHGLFLRLMRAIDVLTAQPEWDGKTLVANGRSQGGGQALAAAGLDSRVTFLAAQIPALCDHTGVVAGRINGWPKLVPLDENGKPNEKALQAARYYDCVNFAARTHAAAFLTVGFIDLSCPPTGVYAAYNSLSGKKDILNHLHTGHVATPEADAAVRDAVLGYLKTTKP
ncbi:MAG: acetylxylan esterase [Verrucomicrobia bacterium]|nr:acetylxylan esterase [Verrucomicrobiota bacterium]